MSSPARVHRVHPTHETLNYWADHLLPDLDVWFWDGDPLDLDLTACMVMPRADYLHHPTFRDIRYVNAYLHWQMPPDVTQIVVSGPSWISGLAARDRLRVLEKQVSLRRGLVFPQAYFDGLPVELQAYAVDGDVVLCHAAWRAVPNELRQTAVLSEQRRWDDVDCLPVPDDAPDHIRAIANTFGRHEGANCLAITAYCVTGEAWMRNLWMFQPAFHDLIVRHGYRPVQGVQPVAGDVVTFETDGKIVHAAWCVGHERFLNKNGQSRFNPIRIVDWTTLETDWHDATCVIHRRHPALHGDRA